jgi:hypothetical protein
MNTFINEILIPVFLKKDFEIEMVIRFLISTIEGTLLVLFIQQLNVRYLFQIKPAKILVSWIIVFEILIMIIVCAIMYYQIYQHDK